MRRAHSTFSAASVISINDDPGDPGVDHFRNGTAAEGNDRRAACHGLDHDETKGLWPVNREEQRTRIAEELSLLMFVNLADELDVWAALHQRFYHRGPNRPCRHCRSLRRSLAASPP